MTVKNRKPTPQLLGPRWRELSPAPEREPSPAPALVPQEASFHASLSECAKKPVTDVVLPVTVPAPVRPWAKLTQTGALGVLVRVGSWLRARYTDTTNKRLRVSETVSLGEKRFVALVTVEGREFLVGGGASGVSSMTHLGMVREPADAFRREIRVQGESE
jgi:Flagellar biosynthesis protein, FliO